MGHVKRLFYHDPSKTPTVRRIVLPLRFSQAHPYVSVRLKKTTSINIKDLQIMNMSRLKAARFQGSDACLS